MNKGQMKAHQAEMKKKQARIKELMKNSDEKSKKELAQLEKELMEGMSQMMKGSMKSMMFTWLLIIPLWAFFGWNYADVVIPLAIPVPFWAAWDWVNPASWIQFKLYDTTNWIGWYILVSLLTSIVFGIIIKIYDKVRG